MEAWSQLTRFLAPKPGCYRSHAPVVYEDVSSFSQDSLTFVDSCRQASQLHLSARILIPSGATTSYLLPRPTPYQTGHDGTADPQHAKKVRRRIAPWHLDVGRSFPRATPDQTCIFSLYPSSKFENAERKTCIFKVKGLNQLYT